jgi:6-phosphogluconolactonase
MWQRPSLFLAEGEIFMQTTRRNTFKLAGLALALGSLGMSVMAAEDDDGFRSGKVFTSTNATAGNELLVYATDSSGQLALLMRAATQGQGTGTGLGNQGAVTLSGNGKHLFVVNAQSNSVSTFSVRRSGIALESTVDSGGLRPISVTEHDGIVYVLNAAGAGNVAGFRNDQGVLKPLDGSVRPLSASGGTASSQVGFSPDGDTLLVTEKATNKLTSYRVRNNGSIDAPVVTASVGVTPFGFAFDRRGNALVSEAFGGAANASAVSSYRFDHATPANPIVISPSVGTTQTAACWVVVTPNSSYAVTRSGKLSLLQGIAATTGAGPIDAAVSTSGRKLYVLNGRSQTISSFSIAADASLSSPGTVAGLPVGANGLAAN